MRIAIVNSLDTWGGTMRVAVDLARAFLGFGHEVVLIGRKDTPLAAGAGDLHVEELIGGGWRGSPLAVARALRSRKIDVLLATAPGDLRHLTPWVSMFGIPVVVCWVEPHGLKRRWSPRRRLWARFQVAQFVANSYPTARALQASASWLTDDRVTVILLGIDASESATTEPADLGVRRSPDDIVFGFVGRLEPQKGIDDLLAAWPDVARLHPEAHLVFAGRGKLQERVEEGARTLPRVTWLGFRQDVRAVMRAVDVVVMPSREEGFGLVALEAMAAGRPLIAGAVDNLSDLVRDGIDGVLVPPSDPAALARAMLMLFDSEARERIGDAARARVLADFTLDAVARAYERVLVAAAASQRGTASPRTAP